jgi:hypothetical protein
MVKKSKAVKAANKSKGSRNGQKKITMVVLVLFFGAAMFYQDESEFEAEDGVQIVSYLRQRHIPKVQAEEYALKFQKQGYETAVQVSQLNQVTLRGLGLKPGHIDLLLGSMDQQTQQAQQAQQVQTQTTEAKRTFGDHPALHQLEQQARMEHRPLNDAEQAKVMLDRRVPLGGSAESARASSILDYELMHRPAPASLGAAPAQLGTASAETGRDKSAAELVLTNAVLTRLRGLVRRQQEWVTEQQQQSSVAVEAEKRLNAIEATLASGLSSAAAEESTASVGTTLTKWTPLICRNKKLDGEESDVDCGGKVCNKCANGKSCKSSADCASLKCDGGACAKGPWKLISLNLNSMCDTLKDPVTGASARPVYEGDSNGEDDCVAKCEASAAKKGDEGGCVFANYWVATKWCRLTRTCATESADPHKDYEVCTCLGLYCGSCLLAHSLLLLSFALRSKSELFFFLLLLFCCCCALAILLQINIYSTGASPSIIVTAPAAAPAATAPAPAAAPAAAAPAAATTGSFVAPDTAVILARMKELEAKAMKAQQTDTANAKGWSRIEKSTMEVLDRLDVKIEKGSALSPQRVAELKLQLKLLGSEVEERVREFTTGGESLLISEGVNAKCDDDPKDKAKDKSFEGKVKDKVDCLRLCKARGWCNFYSHWIETGWCKLTVNCDKTSADPGREYVIDIYARNRKDLHAAAAAASEAAVTNGTSNINFICI